MFSTTSGQLITDIKSEKGQVLWQLPSTEQFRTASSLEQRQWSWKG